jgi:hypothetical protein
MAAAVGRVPPELIERGQELRRVAFLDLGHAQASLEGSAARERYLEGCLAEAVRGVIKANSQIPWN